MMPRRRRAPARIGWRAAVLLASAAVLPVACGDGGAESAGSGGPPAGRPRLAGVSTRLRYTVDSLSPGEMGSDTLLPVYHRFHHRCSACHAVPSPAQVPAGSWPRVVERMRGNIDEAGLLPLEKDEAEEYIELLQRNASQHDSVGKGGAR